MALALIRRRALWGWIAGAVILGGMFVAASLARPTVPGASAGVVSRVGMLTLVSLFPVLLAGRAISRFTADNAVAAVGLPVFLSVVLGGLVLLFGFVPEDTKLCTAFERYGFEPDPACYTPMSTRLSLLGEGYVVWLLFGGVLYGMLALRARKAQRAAART